MKIQAFKYAAWLVLATGMGWAQVARNGSIGGTVLDEKGNPFEGARVMATLLADQTEKYTPWQGYAVSGKDGSYEVANAPSGRFELCLYVPGNEYVNVCQWGKPVAVVSVGAGARTTSNVNLTLGKEVRLRLDDPEGYLERHDGKTIGAIVSIGVYTEERMIITAEPLGQQVKGSKAYRVLVPVDAKWRVRADSPFFTFEAPNEGAQPLAVLMELDQKVKATEKDKEILVRVKGLKAQVVAQ